jgi:excisionase family DNA binding protein
LLRRTLKVQEVAEYLGVHQDTIYNMVKQKEIPHFRVRKRILFTREAIDSWILHKESQYSEEAI